jgi:hypothetical protein
MVIGAAVALSELRRFLSAPVRGSDRLRCQRERGRRNLKIKGQDVQASGMKPEPVQFRV